MICEIYRIPRDHPPHPCDALAFPYFFLINIYICEFLLTYNLVFTTFDIINDIQLFKDLELYKLARKLKICSI